MFRKHDNSVQVRGMAPDSDMKIFWTTYRFKRPVGDIVSRSSIKVLYLIGNQAKWERYPPMAPYE